MFVVFVYLFFIATGLLCTSVLHVVLSYILCVGCTFYKSKEIRRLLPIISTCSAEFTDHGLDSYVTVSCQDVSSCGFGLRRKADAGE